MLALRVGPHPMTLDATTLTVYSLPGVIAKLALVPATCCTWPPGSNVAS